jgi:hypothetical protein
MEKLTINKIQRYTTDREGNPLKTSKGKPYERVLIYTDKYEGAISGFGNKINQRWNEGDEVEVLVEKKGKYLNFKTELPTISPEAFNSLKDLVYSLEDRVSRLENGNEPMDDLEEIPF